MLDCCKSPIQNPPLPPGEGRGEGNPSNPLSARFRVFPRRPSPRPSPGGRGGPFARATLIAFLVAALIAAVWNLSRPAAIGPAAGIALQGSCPQTPTSQSFRVGTFNIHGCKGLDGRCDPERVAKCLEGLDFVALQEVHGPRPWQTLDQAGELGKRLASMWLFAPNTRVWRCLDSGNGLLSRLPVESWQSIPLPNYGGRGYRNVVLVQWEHGGRTIRALLTHIARGEPEERSRQLRTVISLYLGLTAPAILLGDLNTTGNDPQMRRLLAAAGVADAVGKVLRRRIGPAASIGSSPADCVRSTREFATTTRRTTRPSGRNWNE